MIQEPSITHVSTVLSFESWTYGCKMNTIFVGFHYGCFST